MSKNGGIISILVMVPILSLIGYIGDLRCQENLNNIDAQYRSKYGEKSVTERKDDEMRDDRNIGIEILELIIKRNLNEKYSKIETDELEALLEKRR